MWQWKQWINGTSLTRFWRDGTLTWGLGDEMREITVFVTKKMDLVLSTTFCRKICQACQRRALVLFSVGVCIAAYLEEDTSNFQEGKNTTGRNKWRKCASCNALWRASFVVKEEGVGAPWQPFGCFLTPTTLQRYSADNSISGSPRGIFPYRGTRIKWNSASRGSGIVLSTDSMYRLIRHWGEGIHHNPATGSRKHFITYKHTKLREKCHFTLKSLVVFDFT